MRESIKFLHEELGMRNIFFNRVMEDHVLDTAEELWELIQQFEKSIEYIAEHHAGLYCDTFGYAFTQSRSKKELLKKTPDWSRCGFGRMPALPLDGNAYPCFRLVPGSNSLKDSAKYRQGTFNSLLENEDVLRKLNINSHACNMDLKEKCEECSIFNICPHCAADCVNNHGAVLAKTTSVCNFTRLQVYYARKYWEKIKSLYPSLYQKYKITWTQEEQNELLELVLKEIISLKDKENENDNCES
jgi:radical SAM protein with 4Fe4S-binding SPASM domain